MSWDPGQHVDLDSVRLFYRSVGTSAQPLVLLHGWPQTSLCWRHVVPQLAEHFTVIVPDLRGYGGSGLSPEGYDKRETAADLGQLAEHLGHDTVFVAGHDRGARVAHRWALDEPDRVSRVALLDILPTREVMETFDLDAGKAMWHWLFHLQPELPELLLRDHTEDYLRFFLRDPMEKGAIDTATFNSYVEALKDPEHLHATIEDYRAGFGVDLDRDQVDYSRGHSVRQPLLALWGAAGGLRSRDVVGIWKRYAHDVRGASVPDCGHYLPEEKPADVSRALIDFYAQTTP